MLEPIPFALYLNCVLLPVISLPLVLLMIPNWRFGRQGMVWVSLVLTGALSALALLLYYTLGAVELSCWLAGLIGSGIIAAVLYGCNLYRDGRAFFALVTVMVNTSIFDMITTCFFNRADYRWIMLRAGLVAVNCLVIWFFFRKPLFEMLYANSIRWWWYSLLPLSVMCCLDGYLIHYTTPLPLVQPLLLSAAAVLSYFILYSFQRAINAQAQATQDAALLRAEVEALHRQTALAQSAAADMRIFRHDTRHYISLLRTCLAGHSLPDAEALLDTMEHSASTPLPGSPLQEYTGNTLIDTVLTQGAARALPLRIDYSVRMTLPEPLPMDAAELAVVLSNILENAFNTTGKEPPDKPRTIHVEGVPHRGKLLLVVSNSFSGQVDIDPVTGLPRAPHPGPGHGYGTHSIANFAQKYGCLVDCSLRSGIFQLRLMG